MTNPAPASSLILSLDRRVTNLILAFTCVLILMGQPMQAQFQVLHYFTGGADGATPPVGLTAGGPGALYGSAGGGLYGNGVVFKLTQRGSGWTLTPLYEFTGGHDGGSPAGVVFGPGGALYGTTYGGGSAGDGTIFELRPPVRICENIICYWNETVRYSFTGHQDGGLPKYGNVIFDQAGNIYGTTSYYGDPTQPCGNVWELEQSGDRYQVLYDFTGGPDGCMPASGVIFDTAGNLYGNTQGNEPYNPSVYELSPSNGSWVETTLGELPQNIAPSYNSLVIDQGGNLFGTGDGFNGGEPGGVYEASPSDGLSTVYTFTVGSCRPFAGVTLGPNGNLYGVCMEGGAFGYGWVFEMPPNCNQRCTPTDLHDFDNNDGAIAYGPVVFDASGNLYGTTGGGGIMSPNCWEYGCGVIYEIAGVADSPRQ
jgi:uncharacterized repeat protein (TIGR03803 family)